MIRPLAAAGAAPARRPEESPEVKRALAALTPRAPGQDPLADLFSQSLRVALLDAMARAPRPPGAAPPLPPASPAAAALAAESAEPSGPAPASNVPLAGPLAPFPPPTLPALPGASTLTPAEERATIARHAAREGIDPDFLAALRRVENGGPGREFGVLSVPAPTYEDQARVAAETVRRNIERFERGGRTAVDPATGRYTVDFVRFFSGRYAPIGAANDPTGLNQHHARNLTRVYARLASRLA